MPKLAKVIGANLRPGQTPGGFTIGTAIRLLVGRGRIKLSAKRELTLEAKPATPRLAATKVAAVSASLDRL